MPASCGACQTSFMESVNTTATTLSTTSRWAPELDGRTTGDGDGVIACRQPSSTDCVTALISDVNTLTALTTDIGTTDANAYPATSTRIQKMISAADLYNANHCLDNPAADKAGSACYKDAQTVTTGMTALEDLIRADERGAAVK